MIEATPFEPGGMRIRSEPLAAGPSRFVPVPVDDALDECDPRAFDRLTAAVAAALGALARTDASAKTAGGAQPDWADGNGSEAGGSLVAALTAIRFGGLATDSAEVGGVTALRMRQRLGAMLDELAAAHWPAEARGAGALVELTMGGAGYALWLAAPPRPARTAATGDASLAEAIWAMPFRMPVAVSAEMAELSRLLPFAEGSIWPISPQPVVPLRLAGQRVASIRIEPTPDGRQQAVVIEGARR